MEGNSTVAPSTLMERLICNQSHNQKVIRLKLCYAAHDSGTINKPHNIAVETEIKTAPHQEAESSNTDIH